MALKMEPVLFSPVATACGFGSGCGNAVARPSSAKVARYFIFAKVQSTRLKSQSGRETSVCLKKREEIHGVIKAIAVVRTVITS